jgi:hypothetical protein
MPRDNRGWLIEPMSSIAGCSSLANALPQPKSQNRPDESEAPLRECHYSWKWFTARRIQRLVDDTPSCRHQVFQGFVRGNSFDRTGKFAIAPDFDGA